MFKNIQLFEGVTGVSSSLPLAIKQAKCLNLWDEFEQTEIEESKLSLIQQIGELIEIDDADTIIQYIFELTEKLNSIQETKEYKEDIYEPDEDIGIDIFELLSNIPFELWNYPLPIIIKYKNEQQKNELFNELMIFTAVEHATLHLSMIQLAKKDQSGLQRQRKEYVNKFNKLFKQRKLKPVDLEIEPISIVDFDFTHTHKIGVDYG